MAVGRSAVTSRWGLVGSCVVPSGHRVRPNDGQERTPMMASTAAALVIRDAIPRDFLPITNVLTAALAESPIARWLDPEEGRRRLTMLAYIGGLVRQTITAGVARVAEESGEIVGAALWALHDGRNQFVGSRLADDTDRTLTEVHRRRRQLDHLAGERRPRDLACQQLACLGVRPDRQGRGVGSHLLIGHHAFLHLTKTPAYLVAPDDILPSWFERYGYSGVGPEQLLPGGLPMQAMWRPPGRADPR